MLTSTTPTIAVETIPAPSFWPTLSSLPEELILEILEHVLSLSGCIAKTDFYAGYCEWPSCHCQGNSWYHTPAKKLTMDNLTPLLAATEPIPRLAQLTFYASNTFHLCGPQNDIRWAGSGFWLPPRQFRQWIRRLEVEVQINFARPGSPSNPSEEPVFGITPTLDWQFLRRLQQGVHGFTGLRTLKMMFEALFITRDEQLRRLDKRLAESEPFSFQAQELIVEACSAYPVWLEDDFMSNDLVVDERLGKVLEKYVSANGKKPSSPTAKNDRAAKRLRWQDEE
ncbi:hypothetical protein SVAN01_07209 [Stagonosporopsis vannaccii]|nr:hypothetical protein SVAN01_07209 [Stagonosporopsis vannaccii]